MRDNNFRLVINFLTIEFVSRDHEFMILEDSVVISFAAAGAQDGMTLIDSDPWRRLGNPGVAGGIHNIEHTLYRFHLVLGRLPGVRLESIVHQSRAVESRVCYQTRVQCSTSVSSSESASTPLSLMITGLNESRGCCLLLPAGHR